MSSKKMYEEAAAIYREIGDQRGLLKALNDLAILYKNQDALPGVELKIPPQKARCTVQCYYRLVYRLSPCRSSPLKSRQGFPTPQ